MSRPGRRNLSFYLFGLEDKMVSYESYALVIAMPIQKPRSMKKMRISSSTGHHGNQDSLVPQVSGVVNLWATYCATFSATICMDFPVYMTSEV